MFDLINEIGQTMRTNKLRTFLTGIAVTWGIFMLIVLLSVARGVTNSFDYRMASNSEAKIELFSGRTSKPYKGNREGRRVRLKDSDMKILPQEDRHFVEGVTSQLNGGGTLATPKAKVSAGYRGVYPTVWNNSDLKNMTGGRFISNKDMDEKAKVMILPDEYARQLFPPDGKSAIGGRVTCNGLSFLVIGTYKHEWRRDVYIPFTTARMMAADREDLNNLTVQLQNVKTEDDGNAAEADIKETLAETHNFDPKDENAIYVWNQFTDAVKMQSAMGILNYGVWALGILTLLTGIVGVSNIMFVTVRERTHEIGIRRAIGAHPSQILTQFIAESIAITLVFGFLGILLGMLVTQVVASGAGDDMLRNPTVSLSIAFEVMAVLVFAGAMAGLAPAMKALKVKPVEALSEE